MESGFGWHYPAGADTIEAPWNQPDTAWCVECGEVAVDATDAACESCRTCDGCGGVVEDASDLFQCEVGQFCPDCSA